MPDQFPQTCLHIFLSKSECFTSFSELGTKELILFKTIIYILGIDISEPDNHVQYIDSILSVEWCIYYKHKFIKIQLQVLF